MDVLYYYILHLGSREPNPFLLDRRQKNLLAYTDRLMKAGNLDRSCLGVDERSQGRSTMPRSAAGAAAAGQGNKKKK